MVTGRTHQYGALPEPGPERRGDPSSRPVFVLDLNPVLAVERRSDDLCGAVSEPVRIRGVLGAKMARWQPELDRPTDNQQSVVDPTGNEAKPKLRGQSQRGSVEKTQPPRAVGGCACPRLGHQGDLTFDELPSPQPIPRFCAPQNCSCQFLLARSVLFGSSVLTG
jgi:hypothetical protein